jgi:hypothetical protein
MFGPDRHSDRYYQPGNYADLRRFLPNYHGTPFRVIGVQVVRRRAIEPFASMGEFVTSTGEILAAVIGLALVAALVSRTSNTAEVLKAHGDALEGLLDKMGPGI